LGTLLCSSGITVPQNLKGLIKEKNESVFNLTILLFGVLMSFMLSSPFLNPINLEVALSSSARVESSGGSSQLGLPRIYDISLKAEIIFQGLDFPTSFAFLDADDVLILEKNTGKVRRIVNGSLIPEPLLDANVSKVSERGMLGIAVEKNENKAGPYATTDVFLYFTESRTSRDGDNECPPPGPNDCKQETELLGNRLYRYELVNNKLVNPKLLLDLPAKPGPNHNGGRITIGPDNNVYLTIGDLNILRHERFFTRAENVEKGWDPDGRAGILRITQDGLPLLNDSLIGDNYPLDLYYAYGIRNSFGIDFDPLTGNLWDTENGLGFGDEINLVEPGFNSGWRKVQGFWKEESTPAGPIMSNAQKGDMLVDFEGNGKYSDPEFTWVHPVGLTALKFLDSERYGKEYENDIFVGDFHNGNIYHFDLAENRTVLELDGVLKDKVANGRDELKTTLFGQGFGGITDIEVGPDGYLYVLSIYQGGDDCILGERTTASQDSDKLPCIFYNSQLQGALFRVVPESVTSS